MHTFDMEVEHNAGKTLEVKVEHPKGFKGFKLNLRLRRGGGGVGWEEAGRGQVQFDREEVQGELHPCHPLFICFHPLFIHDHAGSSHLINCYPFHPGE